MKIHTIGRLAVFWICFSNTLTGIATGQDKSLTLTWAPNTETDLVSYKVYQGTRSAHYDTVQWVAGTNRYVTENLRDGIRYFFAVSAVDQWGNESPLSNEVSALAGDATLPAELSLTNNYPNPFNSNTVIELNIPDDRFVKLNIYNQVGQVVRVLRDERFLPGRYYISWDGLDDFGQPVATGTYFYQLESGQDFQSKKMTLIR